MTRDDTSADETARPEEGEQPPRSVNGLLIGIVVMFLLVLAVQLFHRCNG